MKRELPYFSIEGAFGGSQEWFTHDWWMRKGGCAAVTATEMYPLYWTPSKEGTFCVIRLNLS